MRTIYSLLFFVAILYLKLTAVEGSCFHRHGAPIKFHGIVKRQADPCDSSAVYRTMDGQCNNLDNPLWGAAATILDRALPAAYEDDVESPRLHGVGGNPLPSARVVSLRCHPHTDGTDEVTIMVMHWGQFIDHDISLTPKGDENDCPCDSDPSTTQCLPIEIPDDDDFFTTRDCLEFIRSNSVMQTGTHHEMTPIRQQLNAISTYMDASTVYGSSDAQAAGLRFENGHELKVLTDEEGDDFMPPDNNAKSCRPDRGHYCYLAGDARSNVQAALSGLHTLFVREHNRIANIFKTTTPWDDETIFQETRKIIGAFMQVINYKEYLPIVLGPRAMAQYDLELSHFEYDANMRADVLNSFATAAFRFGHSQIPDNLDLTNHNDLAFKDIWLKPQHIYSKFDDVFLTSGIQKSTVSDRFFAHSVTRHLFTTDASKGSDLPALNIQRGRDHGIPAYNEWREWCGLDKKTTLGDVFREDPVAAATYEHVDDVDLFSGAMAEDKVRNGLVGETFACILGVQFERLKSGDRFFYLTDDATVGFSSDQIDQLNSVTLSQVICANTEIESLQSNIFLPGDPSTNPTTNCEDLEQQFSLEPWIPDVSE